MKKLFLITGLMFAFVDLAQAQLASPTLLKPDNAANLPLKKATKFTWQKVTGATKYRLIFSNDKSFSNYDANKFKCLNARTCFMYTIASPSHNVAAFHAMLKTDGNYFWQVQAISSKDRSQITTPTTEAGDVHSFSVGKVPVVINTTSSPYTKIANNGSELSDDAKLGTAPTDWACTKDNKTGLIWEIKTDDGGLHDKDWTYTEANINVSYAECFISGNCNISAYSSAVNAQGLCAATDWRMPALDELKGLVYCSNGKYNPTTTGEDNFFICESKDNGNPIMNNTSTTINATYFPNTLSLYMGFSPNSYASSDVGWIVNFYNSNVRWFKEDSSGANIRLVRNANRLR